MTPKQAIPGAVLNDRYTLTDRIASGGMGEVWAASDTVLGRTVAVKLLNPALSQESGFVERFRAEARHSAALHHPNITTVFDYGEDDGTAYLVMELVVGQPLSQIISERAPLSAQETSSILIQAATALEAAHQGGVVHRDVKPANILITPDGTAKLTDFGISRLVDTAPLTQTGQIVGTAQYLSPEQAMGRSATAASDIYALGVVGHEMLTGQRPFDAGTMVATALAHINQPPPQLPATVPVGLRDIVAAALAKDPADRPASAAAMAQALGMPAADAASGSSAVGTPGTPAGSQAVGALAVAALAVPARTQAMPSQATPGQALPTQVMPSQVMPVQPAVTPRSRSRRRSAWLLAAAAVAAVVLGILTAITLSDGSLGNGPAPAPVTTSNPGSGTTPSSTTPSSTTPSSTTQPTSPTPSTSTTAVIAPPAVTEPPRQDNKGKGKGKDEDENKDGN